MDGDLSKISKKEETPVAVDTVVQSGSGGSGKLIAGAAVVAVALALIFLVDLVSPPKLKLRQA